MAFNLQAYGIDASFFTVGGAAEGIRDLLSSRRSMFSISSTARQQFFQFNQKVQFYVNPEHYELQLPFRAKTSVETIKGTTINVWPKSSGSFTCSGTTGYLKPDAIKQFLKYLGGEAANSIGDLSKGKKASVNEKGLGTAFTNFFGSIGGRDARLLIADLQKIVDEPDLFQLNGAVWFNYRQIYIYSHRYPNGIILTGMFEAPIDISESADKPWLASYSIKFKILGYQDLKRGITLPRDNPIGLKEDFKPLQISGRDFFGATEGNPVTAAASATQEALGIVL